MRTQLLISCILATAACSGRRATDPPSHGVPALAEAVRLGLAREGPRAWLRYFVRDSGFYMASAGQLVFPTIGVADSSVAKLANTFRTIDLRWPKPRVDSFSPTVAGFAAPFEETLTDSAGHAQQFRGFVTGIAVQVDSGWKIRSLHWSLAEPQVQR